MIKCHLPALILFCLCSAACSRASPASKDSLPALLVRLDSLQHTNSPGRYFAALYLSVSREAATLFLPLANKRERELMEKLSLHFAGYFFQAAEACRKDEGLPAPWQASFGNDGSSPARQLLYGINAHINGDIWKALTTCFTPAELAELKPVYKRYYQVLKRQYDLFYDLTLVQSGQFRRLHTFSLGFSRHYGKYLVKVWRKRQFRLAEMYFSNERRFERKRKKVERKAARTDKLISRYIR